MKNQPRKASVPEMDLGNPRQILDMVQNSKIAGLVTLICASKGTIKADGQPPQAVKAAGEFWRCLGIEPKSKSEDYLLGFLLGFAQGLKISPTEIKREFREPVLSDFLRENDLAAFAGNGYAREADESPEAAADFFAGFKDGKQAASNVTQNFNPAHTAWAYLLIAICWQEIAALKTVSAIHNWLVSKQVIPKNADPRNTRTLLRRIGFPFVAAGRPQKIKTATAR